MTKPRFSLIVPAYNESELLPRLLESLEVARNRYRGGAQQIEVIVADNNSSDDTAKIAEAAGARTHWVERRCIASARNGGARVSTGEIVCFVDADSIVHPDTFNAIEDGLTDQVVAGSSGVLPEKWTFGLRITFGLMMSILWVLDMDSGVFFCRRKDFDEVGGYDEDRMFAEDVHFFMALKLLGRKRRPKQRLVRLKGVKTLTSTRKFDKHGQWHLLTTSLKYAVMAPFGPAWERKFAWKYWYEDR